MGYYPSWKPDKLGMVDFGVVSHVCYAFAIPKADGSLRDLDNPETARVLLRAAHDSGAKVLLSVGGWSYNDTLNAVDFINVMAYDGGDDERHSTYQFAVDCGTYWKETRGLPAHKAVLGVPFLCAARLGGLRNDPGACAGCWKQGSYGLRWDGGLLQWYGHHCQEDQICQRKSGRYHDLGADPGHLGPGEKPFAGHWEKLKHMFDKTQIDSNPGSLYYSKKKMLRTKGGAFSPTGKELFQ